MSPRDEAIQRVREVAALSMFSSNPLEVYASELLAAYDEKEADLAGVDAALLDAGIPPLGNLGKRVGDLAHLRKQALAERDEAHAAVQGIATVLAAAVGTEACPPVTAGNLHAVVDECLARLNGQRADGAMLIRQIDRQQARIAAMREEQRLVDKLTADIAAVRMRARSAWFDLLARHEREKAGLPLPSGPVVEKHTHEQLRLAGVANHDEGRTCFLCGGDVPSGFKHEHGAGVCTAAGLLPRITPDEVAGTPATSDDRGGPDDGAQPAPPAIEAGGGGVSGLDLVAHLRRQREFSLRTFGPGSRSAGVVDHIRKELLEIESAPTDLAEWIDVVILAFDGAWRIGATPEQIVAALLAKQAKNEARTWPDWRKADPSKAIEHDRSRDGGSA